MQMNIAERKLKYRAADSATYEDVIVAIRSVTPDSEANGLAACSVETTCGTTHIQNVYGEDSLQAVSLGLFEIVQFLRGLDSTGELNWFDGESYNFKNDFQFMRPLEDMLKRIGPITP